MKLNNIDLNKLNVFFQVMESGDYTGASAALNVTKSAVSQSITGLEAQIGVVLFLRKSRRLIPTPQAEELYLSFGEYQNKLLENIKKISVNTETAEGLIKVGSYLEFAKKELSPFLKSFLEEHSEVQIKLKFDSPTRLRELLEKNKIDLAFSIYPVKNVKGLSSEKILKEELVMICKKGQKNKFKKFDDFLNTSCVAYYSDQKSLKRWVSLHFGKRVKSFKVSLFAATAEMVLASVKEGVGIGVVPHYLVDKDVDVIRPTDKKLEDFIWLNHYKDQYVNSGHKAFVERVSTEGV